MRSSKTVRGSAAFACGPEVAPAVVGCSGGCFSPAERWLASVQRARNLLQRPLELLVFASASALLAAPTAFEDCRRMEGNISQNTVALTVVFVWSTLSQSLWQSVKDTTLLSDYKH